MNEQKNEKKEIRANNSIIEIFIFNILFFFAYKYAAFYIIIFFLK